MATLFEDLKEGINQAIDYAEGKGSTRVFTYKIDPVKEYDNEQIRRIRMDAGMTQRVFADYLGVSIKTVEAWERGRTHPTGPAYRLIDFLVQDKAKDLPFITIEYHKT